MRILFQPTTDENILQSYLYRTIKRSISIYEEVINKEGSIISGDQLDHDKTDHRPLQLIAGYSYQRKKAVFTGTSSFVMPYRYKEKVGSNNGAHIIAITQLSKAENAYLLWTT